MNINIIRAIDRYAGPVICRLVLFLGKPWRSSSGANSLPADLAKVRNILVIKYFGIGTILLASPAIMRLKKKYPNADITMITLAANKEICQILPSVNNILCLSIDSIPRFIKSYLGILRKVKKIPVDILIDMEFFTNFSALTTLLVLILTPVRMTIGFQSPIKWRNRVYHTVVSFDHGRHISNIFLKVIRVLCSDDHNDQISFQPEKSAMLENADSKFYNDLFSVKELMAKDKKIICINIDAGALSLHRRWPKESFLFLVRELIKRPDVIIQLIGSQDSQSFVSDFYNEIPQLTNVRNLCGKTTIRQLIGLLSNSTLLVTNDGGPLHLAHVIGVPTVSFFGPETPCLYGPLGERHHVFYEDLFCSPCLNIYNSKLSDCRENVCLQRIQPERVLKLINEKYLSGPTKA